LHGWRIEDGKPHMEDTPSHEEPAVRQKTCARCGTVFGCRSEIGGCWCADEPVYLPMPVPGSPEAAEDCLCPTCLRAESARRLALLRV
jgi:hypothetical protein